MRKWMAVIALAALCASVAHAQGEDAALRKKVDAVFAAYDKPDSPGCALGVIQEGALTYIRGYGRANLEHSLPITSKTVFDIGSTSKQFTAASILLLEQQGKLSLDDDIRKFVPELPDYGTKITIRYLVHHTSGLRDYLTLMSLAGVDFHGVTTDADALAIIARQKALNFAPGDEYLYSNSGYFLMAVIVQRASGKSLREFAQEHIFGPLRMTSTHYHNDHAEVTPNRASAYEPKDGGGYRIDMSNFEQTGDGAVFTTVEDLLKWDQNFYEPKVGGAALVQALLTRGRLNSGKELDYATGLMVRKHRGLTSVSHGGSWGGYRAELLRFPEQRFSVATLCNVGSSDPSRLARQVAELYLSSAMTPVARRATSAAGAGSETAQGGAETTTAAQLEKYAGVFRNAENGGLRRVSVRDGKLRIDSFGAASMELRAMGGDRFSVADPPSATEIAFDPSRNALVVSRAGEPPEAERFERAEAFAPSLAELSRYAGMYYSEELDVSYRLEMKDGKLWMRVLHDPARELKPAVRDLFVGPFGVRLEFARSNDAALQPRAGSFTVQAGRVRNIRFVRR
ncbi:MAG: serine hydrolase domain-containing protein [Candidatus Acidiferrales bacterium]